MATCDDEVGVERVIRLCWLPHHIVHLCVRVRACVHACVHACVRVCTLSAASIFVFVSHLGAALLLEKKQVGKITDRTKNWSFKKKKD